MPCMLKFVVCSLWMYCIPKIVAAPIANGEPRTLGHVVEALASTWCTKGLFMGPLDVVFNGCPTMVGSFFFPFLCGFSGMVLVTYGKRSWWLYLHLAKYPYSETTAYDITFKIPSQVFVPTQLAQPGSETLSRFIAGNLEVLLGLVALLTMSSNVDVFLEVGMQFGQDPQESWGLECSFSFCNMIKSWWTSVLDFRMPPQKCPPKIGP